MNDTAPSNDEIVAAIRTLQKAGLYDTFSNTNQQAQMFNMFGGAAMNPQVIQAMLTNNMSLGF